MWYVGKPSANIRCPHTVVGHMLVIVKKSSGFGCRITISRATSKMNSHYQQRVTAELGEVYG